MTSQNAASFDTLAEVSPAEIWRTDTEGLCTFVNRRWQETTGMTNGEWMGEGWANAIHPEDRDRVSAAWSEAVDQQGTFREEWRWQRQDGTSPWVLGTGAPVLDQGGQFVGFVGINIDNTENRSLITDLEEARKLAVESARAKSSFLANMSHEIRTPMNGVIGFTDMLLQSDLDEVQRQYVQLIADSGRTMMALLNDILDVSKIEAGQMVVEAEPVDIPHKIYSTVRLLEPSAREKNLVLSVSIADDVPRFLKTDPLRFRQILLNLIGNAIKFTQRGSVSVEAVVDQEADAPRLALTIADSGIGISAEKLETIFDPFMQADGSTARHHGGTGLGLAISRQLSRMMGGDLEAASAEAFGSRFTLYLPMLEVDVAPVVPSVEGTSECLPSVAGRRVLVAEDHKINQRLIMAMCEQIGLRVELAVDGAKAVDMVEDACKSGRPYEAVLMDVQMPEMDGLTACRTLRERGYSPTKLPILALTANCFAEEIAACREAGMQGHIAKPVRMEVLTFQLAEALESARRSLLDGEVADCELDAIARRTLLSLEAEYRLQREGAISAMEQAMAHAEETDWDEITRELHSLAGTAAHFGQAQLGELSRRLEHVIRHCDSDAARLDALRDYWDQFSRAA